MQKFQQVLLGVWREACRHIEIGRSARTITAMILDDVPLAQLFVRKIDFRRKSIETVAVGLPEGEHASSDASTPCTASQLRRLKLWADKGNVVHHPRGEKCSAEMKLASPVADDCHFLAGPLQVQNELLGVVVFVTSRKHPFTARHRALARVLLDPLSVALANDQRLSRMATLQKAAEAENRSLLRRLGRKRIDDRIVGERSGLRSVLERVELVAASDAPVLIFGETGTGKELVARTIHNRSSRADGPIIRVNCGAIPPELIDSELFGHERGAFTGAVEARKGWFERADGGTLFLDEIGDLPLAAQVRLLRIIQDGWLERVGGEESIHVDVRIVAATHRDLADMVAQGKFRADLWYRISVFPLVLPPLRERGEDVAELAAHFARRAALRFGLPEVMPTDVQIRLLKTYSWPGNIRELASVVDRAAILGNGRRLEVEKALGVTPPGAAPQQSGKQEKNAPQTDILPLERVLREHIEAALTAAAGRVEGPRGAAALLEINPNTLRAKMRKLGIHWQRFRA